MADIKLEIGLKNNENSLLVNKSMINSVNSMTQLNTDPSTIFYGIVGNTGSVEILDRESKIKTMIENEEIDSSNSPIKIFANGKQVQWHKSTSSEYKDKVLNIELGDNLNDFSQITVNFQKVMRPDNTNKFWLSPMFIYGDELLNLIFERTSPKITPTFVNVGNPIIIDYGNGILKPIYPLDYLNNFAFVRISYDAVNGKSLEELLNWFCQATQTNIIQMENGNIGISIARPIYSSNVIYIPKKYLITNGQTSLFLKNKYERVFVNKMNNNDEYEKDQYLSIGAEEYNYSNKNTYTFEENPFVSVDSGFGKGNSAMHLSKYIGKNIIYDYNNGSKTKNIEIFCSDLYYYNSENKAKHWNRGDIVNVGDIIAIENENYLNGEIIKWKVTGREFIYDGYPSVKLELQECFKVSNFEDFSAGLYQNGRMVYSWNYLEQNGLVELKVFENGYVRLEKVSTDLEGDLIVSNKIKGTGNNCFSNCTKLIGVEFLEGTESLGRYAFSNCTSLERVFLPESLNDIMEYDWGSTFIGCSKLTIYTAHNNYFDINKISFSDIHNCKVELVDNGIRMTASGTDPYCSIAQITLPAGTYYFTASSNFAHELYVYDGTQWISKIRESDLENKTYLEFTLTSQQTVTLRLDGAQNGISNVQTFADISLIKTTDERYFRKFWNCHYYNTDNSLNEIYKFCPVVYNYSQVNYEEKFGIN